MGLFSCGLWLGVVLLLFCGMLRLEIPSIDNKR